VELAQGAGGVAAGRDDPLIGKLLDRRYDIRGQIARGGMATVYLALDTRLDRLVAVKVMHPSLAEDPDFVARFHREARTAAGLSHGNVVAVYDQGWDGPYAFLVMEFVAGRTLRALIEERGRLSAGQALSVLEPIASALGAAHARGLVHRDVKPENVLLGDDGRVLVADFGLARAIEVNALTATTGLLLGTVAYVSPEQVRSGRADPRSDVYAAGIVLFEMLTGEAPYDGDTPLSVAYRHTHDDVPAPSTLVAGLPLAVDGLVLAMTARDPDERLPDGTRLLAAVRSARSSLPVGDDRDADAASLTRLPPDQAVTARIDRPAATVVLPKDAQPWQQPLPAPAQRTGSDTPIVGTPVERPRRRRARRIALVTLAVILLAAAGGGGGWWYGKGRFTHVPGLRGLSASAARQLASRDHLVPVTDPAAYSDTVGAGLVLAQSPGTGARLTRGSSVHLRLSLGRQMFSVPAVQRGETVAAPTAAVNAANLKVTGTSESYDPSIAKGALLGITPAAGTKLTAGGGVQLSVSKGPQPIGVPAAAPGSDPKTVEAAITSAGLDVSVQQQTSTDVPDGQVISESPAAGTPVLPGSTVTVVVSTGPPLVSLPDTTGQDVDQATAELQALGLKVSVHRFPFSDTVQGQRPTGGQVRVGSTVTLYVY
jgi:serine/threonine-protein kinase